MWDTIEITGLKGGKITIFIKHYDEASKWGINGGRISKLEMKRNGETIANYDRGWDIEVDETDQDAMAAYYIALNAYN